MQAYAISVGVSSRIAGAAETRITAPRQLETAIKANLEITNQSPRPFVWTKTANETVASVARFCVQLRSLEPILIAYAGTGN